MYFKVSGPRKPDFNRVIADISVVLIETTFPFADSIETGASFETEMMRVVSLGTTEITEITRFKKTHL